MHSKENSILFVAPSLGKGGMERQLSLLFEQFSKKEFEIHIALFKNTIEYNIAPEIKIHNLHKKVKVDVLFVIRLISVIIRVKPLVIFSTISGINNYCQIIGSLLSIPVICSIRSSGKYVDFRVMKLINHLFPYKMVVCNSHHAKAEMLSHIPRIPDGRIKVIPNGIDIDKFKPKIPDSPKFKNKELFVTKQYKFLLVARIEPVKNHIYLMHIFNKLKKGDAVLVFIGNVFDRAYYQECLKVHSMLSMQKGIYWEEAKDDIENYYNWADCFVLPSLFEGCSNALLEAMACELPVAVSEGSDKDRIIVPDVHGFRFSLNNQDEAVDCLTKMQKMNEKKSGMFGRNNRKKIIENYSVSSLVSSNDAIIRSIIKLN